MQQTIEAQETEITTNLADLKRLRTEILAGLKVGKQSPDYKAVSAALNKFIKKLAKN